MKTRLLAPILGVSLIVGLAACGNDASDPVGDRPASDPSTSAPAPTLAGRLMFSRFDESTHTFLSTHIADPDGSNETELPLPGPEGGGRWSRSGKEIAVMTILPDDRVGTAIILPDGTVDRVLDIPDKSLNLVCTVWSPDDSRLACEGWDNKDPSRSGIYTVSAADGSELQRLTTTPKGVVDIPGDYAPDGNTFVFKRAGDEAPGPLQMVGIDDGKLKPFSRTDFDDPGRFSPDGESVLTSDGEQVVVLDLSGEPVRQIEKAGLSLFGPVWSPDGKWIAFSGSGSGPYADIFISRSDGSDQQQVTTTDDNEIVVEWGP
jgi:Tol biopolymer transport system component